MIYIDDNYKQNADMKFFDKIKVNELQDITTNFSKQYNKQTSQRKTFIHTANNIIIDNKNKIQSNYHLNNNKSNRNDYTQYNRPNSNISKKNYLYNRLNKKIEEEENEEYEENINNDTKINNNNDIIKLKFPIIQLKTDSLTNNKINKLNQVKEEDGYNKEKEIDQNEDIIEGKDDKKTVTKKTGKKKLNLKKNNTSKITKKEDKDDKKTLTKTNNKKIDEEEHEENEEKEKEDIIENKEKEDEDDKKEDINEIKTNINEIQENINTVNENVVKIGNAQNNLSTEMKKWKQNVDKLLLEHKGEIDTCKEENKAHQEYFESIYKDINEIKDKHNGLNDYVNNQLSNQLSSQLSSQLNQALKKQDDNVEQALKKQDEKIANIQKKVEQLQVKPENIEEEKDQEQDDISYNDLKKQYDKWKKKANITPTYQNDTDTNDEAISKTIKELSENKNLDSDTKKQLGNIVNVFKAIKHKTANFQKNNGANQQLKQQLKDFRHEVYQAYLEEFGDIILTSSKNKGISSLITNISFDNNIRKAFQEIQTKTTKTSEKARDLEEKINKLKNKIKQTGNNQMIVDPEKNSQSKNTKEKLTEIKLKDHKNKVQLKLNNNEVITDINAKNSKSLTINTDPNKNKKKIEIIDIDTSLIQNPQENIKVIAEDLDSMLKEVSGRRSLPKWHTIIIQLYKKYYIENDATTKEKIKDLGEKYNKLIEEKEEEENEKKGNYKQKYEDFVLELLETCNLVEVEDGKKQNNNEEEIEENKEEKKEEENKEIKEGNENNKKEEEKKEEIENNENKNNNEEEIKNNENVDLKDLKENKDEQWYKFLSLLQEGDNDQLCKEAKKIYKKMFDFYQKLENIVNSYKEQNEDTPSNQIIFEKLHNQIEAAVFDTKRDKLIFQNYHNRSDRSRYNQQLYNLLQKIWDNKKDRTDGERAPKIQLEQQENNKKKERPLTNEELKDIVNGIKEQEYDKGYGWKSSGNNLQTLDNIYEKYAPKMSD